MLANSFFCENLQFGASLYHLSEIFIDDNMMCISLFSYGSSVVVRCMGVHNPPDRISPDGIPGENLPGQNPPTLGHNPTWLYTCNLTVAKNQHIY